MIFPPSSSLRTNPVRWAHLLPAVLLAAIAVPAVTAAPAAPPPTREVQAALAPGAVLERMMAGNARFVAGQPQARDWAEQRRLTAGGQHPLAVVLSCLDSRVPAEVVFDQGLGDLFSARVAGNVLNEDVLGSMEFACKVAGARVIVVLGHTACGAVQGAATGAELGHLTGLLAKIRPALGGAKERHPGAAPGEAAFVDAVAEVNVQQVRSAISARSPILRELVESGRVLVVGAMYDLASGRVTLLPR